MWSFPHHHLYPSSLPPLSFAPRVLIHFDHDDERRYAYFKKLDYFSTECIYSPDAYRGHARAFLKDLEAARPSAIIDIIHSGEAFEVKDEVRATQKMQRTYFGRFFPLHQICFPTQHVTDASMLYRDMQTLRLYVQ